jgi:hypothetical protein
MENEEDTSPEKTEGQTNNGKNEKEKVFYENIKRKLLEGDDSITFELDLDLPENTYVSDIENLCKTSAGGKSLLSNIFSAVDTNLPYTCVLNLNEGHWATIIFAKKGDRVKVLYKDSTGKDIPKELVDEIKKIDLEGTGGHFNARKDILVSKRKEDKDDSNVLYALLNAHLCSQLLEKSSQHFIDNFPKRQEFKTPNDITEWKRKLILQKYESIIDKMVGLTDETHKTLLETNDRFKKYDIYVKYQRSVDKLHEERRTLNKNHHLNVTIKDKIANLIRLRKELKQLYNNPEEVSKQEEHHAKGPGLDGGALIQEDITNIENMPQPNHQSNHKSARSAKTILDYVSAIGSEDGAAVKDDQSDSQRENLDDLILDDKKKQDPISKKKNNTPHDDGEEFQGHTEEQSNRKRGSSENTDDLFFANQKEKDNAEKQRRNEPIGKDGHEHTPQDNVTNGSNRQSVSDGDNFSNSPAVGEVQGQKAQQSAESKGDPAKYDVHLDSQPENDGSQSFSQPDSDKLVFLQDEETRDEPEWRLEDEDHDKTRKWRLAHKNIDTKQQFSSSEELVDLDKAAEILNLWKTSIDSIDLQKEMLSCELSKNEDYDNRLGYEERGTGYRLNPWEKNQLDKDRETHKKLEKDLISIRKIFDKQKELKANIPEMDTLKELYTKLSKQRANDRDKENFSHRRIRKYHRLRRNNPKVDYPRYGQRPVLHEPEGFGKYYEMAKEVDFNPENKIDLLMEDLRQIINTVKEHEYTIQKLENTFSNEWKVMLRGYEKKKENLEIDSNNIESRLNSNLHRMEYELADKATKMEKWPLEFMSYEQSPEVRFVEIETRLKQFKQASKPKTGLSIKLTQLRDNEHVIREIGFDLERLGNNLPKKRNSELKESGLKEKVDKLKDEVANLLNTIKIKVKTEETKSKSEEIKVKINNITECITSLKKNNPQIENDGWDQWNLKTWLDFHEYTQVGEKCLRPPVRHRKGRPLSKLFSLKGHAIPGPAEDNLLSSKYKFGEEVIAFFIEQAKLIHDGNQKGDFSELHKWQQKIIDDNQNIDRDKVNHFRDKKFMDEILGDFLIREQSLKTKGIDGDIVHEVVRNFIISGLEGRLQELLEEQRKAQSDVLGTSIASGTPSNGRSLEKLVENKGTVRARNLSRKNERSNKTVGIKKPSRKRSVTV